MRIALILLAAALVTACSTYSSAPTARAPSRAPSVAVASSVSIVLSADQIALVRSYYGGRAAASGNGRGRGRGNGLPPGIAKNVERGKPLPPGIGRQALPRDLIVRLPVAPSGYEYAVAAGKLLLITAATGLVHQVLVDALFG